MNENSGFGIYVCMCVRFNLFPRCGIVIYEINQITRFKFGISDKPGNIKYQFIAY